MMKEVTNMNVIYEDFSYGFGAEVVSGTVSRATGRG